MQKKLLITSFFLILIVSAVVLFKSYSSNNNETTEETWVSAKKVIVKNIPIEINIIGATVARTVDITPDVSGHVKNILFTDGAAVKQNDVLIELDDSLYRTKKDAAHAQFIYSQENQRRMKFLGKHGAIAQQAIDQADADLKEKRATDQESNVLLQKMKLIAPFDGYVSKSNVNIGDYVNVGQSLVKLTDTQHLRIEYTIPEAYLRFLKIGQEIKIKTADFPNDTFIGKVAYISPMINTQNRSVSLYAEVVNSKGKLIPGMFVEIEQHLGEKINAITIPARSIMPILEGQQVFKIINGKASLVPITIGQRLADEVEVIKGLSKNDVVITDGQMKVKEGIAVHIKS